MNVKVKKFFWKNSFVGVRVRLAFLWALMLAGAVLLTGLAPLPSIPVIVALCVTLAILTITFGWWIKKGDDYFSFTWRRMIPFPTKARYYIVPSVIVGILVGGPVLWISAYANWTEGFYEIMSYLGYFLGWLLGFLIGVSVVSLSVWGIIQYRKKARQAKIQDVVGPLQTKILELEEQVRGLEMCLETERGLIKEAFSGDFIRLLGELTLQWKEGKNPNKTLARVRKTMERALQTVYGPKSEQAIAKVVMKIIRETEGQETSPTTEVLPTQQTDL